MKIGIAQIRPHLGKLDVNEEIHKQMIEQARSEQVQLLIFPELSLTGYQLLDLTYDVARRIESEEIQSLIQQSSDLDLVFGFVEETADYQLFNSAMYASQQKCLSVHRKVYLPTYGMFEESRYFASGKRYRNLSTSWGRIGMLICEDAHHSPSAYLLALEGAQLIIVLSCSPSRGVTNEGLSAEQSWKDVLKTYAMLYGTYFVFANRVGSEDGVSFFGSSALIDPFGQIEAEASLWKEELLVVDIDLEKIKRARFHRSMLRDEDIDLNIRELKRIQKQWIEEGI